MSFDKRNINITDIIGQVVELKRAGSRFVGICPFHSENTPSFFVYRDKFHCFGCGEGGDVIDFVQKYYNLNFKEALNHLNIKSEKKNINKIQKQKNRVNKFREWESGRFQELCMLIRVVEKVMPSLSESWLDYAGEIFHHLTLWKYHADILQYGTDEEKYLLYKENPTFDYKLKWR